MNDTDFAPEKGAFFGFTEMCLHGGRLTGRIAATALLALGALSAVAALSVTDAHAQATPTLTPGTVVMPLTGCTTGSRCEIDAGGTATFTLRIRGLTSSTEAEFTLDFSGSTVNHDFSNATVNGETLWPEESEAIGIAPTESDIAIRVTDVDTEGTATGLTARDSELRNFIFGFEAAVRRAEAAGTSGSTAGITIRFRTDQASGGGPNIDQSFTFQITTLAGASADETINVAVTNIRTIDGSGGEVATATAPAALGYTVVGNALESITFDGDDIPVSGEDDYATGVDSTSGDLVVTAVLDAARIRLCNGTNEVPSGSETVTTNAITVPLDGITTTNVVTRRLIVSDADEPVACNADVAAGGDRAYTFTLAANTATGAAAAATLTGSGSPSPESTVFLENGTIGNSSFTIDITGYNYVDATHLFATVVPSDNSPTQVPGARNPNAPSVGTRTINNTDYEFSIATDSKVAVDDQAYFVFANGSDELGVLIPTDLFDPGVGNNPAEGSESVTINLAAPRSTTVDANRFFATTFTLANNLNGRIGAGVSNNASDSFSGGAGAATFEIIADGALTALTLNDLFIGPTEDSGTDATDSLEPIGATGGTGSIAFANTITDAESITVQASAAAAAVTGGSIEITGVAADGNTPLVEVSESGEGVNQTTALRGFTGGDNTVFIDVSDGSVTRRYTITVTYEHDAEGEVLISRTDTNGIVAKNVSGAAEISVALSDIPYEVPTATEDTNVRLTSLDIPLTSAVTGTDGESTVSVASSLVTGRGFTIAAPSGTSFRATTPSAGDGDFTLRVPVSVLTTAPMVDGSANGSGDYTLTVNTTTPVGTLPHTITITPDANANPVYHATGGTPEPVGLAASASTGTAEIIIGSDVTTLSVLTVGGTEPTGFAAGGAPAAATVDIGANPTTTAIVATATDSNAMVEISGTNVANEALVVNSDNEVTNFTTGDNNLVVTVTAQDGVATATYRVTVMVPIGPPATVDVDTTGSNTAQDTAAVQNFLEDSGSFEIIVSLNNPVRLQDVNNVATGTVDIPFTLNTGSATFGTLTGGTYAPTDADYSVASGSECDPCGGTDGTGGMLKFGVNEDEKRITIAVRPDHVDEVEETIIFDIGASTITLMNTGSTMLATDAGDKATISITDEDTPPTAVSSVVASPATIREKDSGTSTITVRLNSRAVFGRNITLSYGFSPEPGMGNAVLDTDYTAECPKTTLNGAPEVCNATGNLVFFPGEDTVTVNITAIPTDEENPEDGNGEDEGEEVFTFTVSSGTSNSVMNANSSTVVTIRELATEAVVVKNEVETVTTIIGATQVGTISGLIRTRITSPVSVSPPVTRVPSSPDTASALHLPDNPQDLGDMLNGLGLEHSANADGGGVYAVWARGTYTSMEGDPTVDGMKVDYDGDSTGLGIGAEKVTSKYVAGVAVNWLTTDLDLKSEENEGLSKYEESLVMIAPYLALRRGNGRSFWISAGYGIGEADGTTAEDAITASADVSVTFLNTGADFVLTTHQNGELIGSLSALAVRKTVDSFTFAGTDTITATTLNTFRGQGEVTYYRSVEIGDGRVVKPYVGLATLHDAGDKLNDDSHALDLRGGGEFQGDRITASLEISTELLREDHKSWTISGSARYLCSPGGLGASLTLDGSHAADSDMGLEGGYGMAMRQVHRNALLTPFAGMRHGSGGGEFSSGMRLAIGSDMDADLRAARRFSDDEDTLKLNFRRTF